MNPLQKKFITGALVSLVSLYFTFIIDVYTLNSAAQRVFVFCYFFLMSSLALFLKRKFVPAGNRRSFWVAALISGVLLVMCQNTFLPLHQNITLTLSASGQNPQATGGEVWLTAITVDGEDLALSQLESVQNKNWGYNTEYDDYVYYPSSETHDNQLTLNLFGEYIHLTFSSNTWSGNVRITTSAGLDEYLDLYNEDTSTDKLIYSFATTPNKTVWDLERIVHAVGCLMVLTFLASVILQYFTTREKKLLNVRQKVVTKWRLLYENLQEGKKQLCLQPLKKLVMIFCLFLVIAFAAVVLMANLSGRTGTTIVLSGGNQNNESNGHEIWLADLTFDQTSANLSDIPLTDGWIRSSGCIVFAPDDLQSAQPLVIEIPPAEQVSLTFGSHQWSGIVEIVDGGEVVSLDLYSGGGNPVGYAVKSAVSPDIPEWSILVSGLCILIVALFATLLVRLSANNFLLEFGSKLFLSLIFLGASLGVLGVHSQRNAVLYYLIFGIGIFCTCRVAFFSGTNLSRHPLRVLWLLLGAFLLIDLLAFENPGAVNELKVSVTVVFLWLGYVAGLKVRNNRFVQIFAMVLLPPLCVAMIELIGNTNIQNLTTPYWLLNSALWAILLIIFSGLLSVKKLGWYLGATVGLLLAVANHFVIKFKMFALMPVDILNIRTGLDVVGNYEYGLTYSITSGILVFAVIILVIHLFVPQHSTRKAKVVHLGVSTGLIAAGILLISFANLSSVFRITQDPWSSATTYSKYGTTASFITYLQTIEISEPEGYSPAYAQEILSAYITKSPSSDNEQPTIIAIMNESFSDLRLLGDLGDTDNVMWYVDSLDDCIEKGITYTSVRGGGTCNSEFEFLTGNSMSFFGDASPYTQYDFSNTESLVSILANQGYRTIALHPADAVNYRRATVYQQMGFDEFYSMDYFDDCKKLFLAHTTDYDTYKKMIDLIDSADEPLFLFNVTIQNHGGYSTSTLMQDLNLVHVDERYAEYDDVLMYLSLINESNRALEYLIEHYRNSDEKVIVCVFGDHQPGCLEPAFETELMEGTVAESDLACLQMKQGAPYFIWANYDVRADAESGTDMVSSPNYLAAKLLDYAGCQTSAYQNFLLEMNREIPVLNRFGYQDAEGNWIAHNTDSRYQEWFEKYRILQYHNIFAD